MSDESATSDAPAETPAPPSHAQIEAMLASLPAITTPHDSAECKRRAERLSKRGKLPGYEPDPGLFACAAFGAPFDYRLVANHAEGRLTFRAERLKKLPAIYAIVLAITVWPGVVFTDSLLNTWFGWYPNAWWFTWAWYIPLTLFPIPWIWRSVARKSRASALGHAYEQIEKLAATMDGELVES
jgi:hypothetical protein